MSTKARVLITGATGFLGGRACERFLGEGYEVTAQGRNLKIGENLTKRGVRFLALDLSDKKAVMEKVRGFDLVVHSAALSSPWGQYKTYYRSNVVATKNIVEACLQNKIKRLVHVSTPSIYVDVYDRLKVKESDPLPKSGINDYARTKLLAEKEVEEGAKRGLETIVIRPQGIIGPGDTSILPRLIRVASQGTLPVIGNGENFIDLTYVDNVVEALLLAAKAPNSALGLQYNITNGEPVNLYATLDRIFTELGFSYSKRPIPLKKALRIARGLEIVHRGLRLKREPLLTRYGVCVMGLSRTLDITLAKEKLNYKPIVNMDTALSEIVRSYKSAHQAEL